MRTTNRHRWRMRLPLPFSKGVERGGLVFTGGQCDLDGEGRVLNPGDTIEQIRATVVNGLDVLGDLDVPAANIVLARSFVVGLEPTQARSALRARLEQAGAHDAAASVIPLAALYYDGLVAETDFLAFDDRMAGVRFRAISDMEASYAAACDGFLSMTHLLGELDQRLIGLGAERANVLRLTVYWPDEVTQEAYTAAREARRNWSGWNAPVFTDLCVHDRAPRLEALLIFGGQPCSHRLTTRLPGSLEADAVVIGPVLATSGIVSLDERFGILEQTEACMDRLDELLAAADFKRTDIARLSTYYVGGATAAELHDNLSLRARRFVAPGPASTGVPVHRLPQQGARIAIEAIAIKERAS